MFESSCPIDLINKRTMRSAVGIYARSDGLTQRERAALAYVRSSGLIGDLRILDIGVGGGRTVEGLLDISEDYIGIDYVEEMVDKCRRKFPGVRFEQGDARDLSRFADNSFSLVIFSMNGISMVNHDGRIKILREVFRVLAPGGYFLFSTYNQDNPECRKLLRVPRFVPSMNPLKMGVRCWKHPVGLISMVLNRCRFKALEHHSQKYSIINDRCHNYATMLYYITQARQRSQLVDAGFDEEVLAFDYSGNLLEDDTLEDSIFYVAQK